MVKKRVEFGVFMPVGEGGWIRSTTTPPVPATYAYNRQVGQLADSLSLDFLLAMAKWRGFGGASGHWETTIESLTLVAALASVQNSPSHVHRRLGNDGRNDIGQQVPENQPRV